jgi:hypothetical protein
VVDTGSAEMPSLPRRVIGRVVGVGPGSGPAWRFAFGHTICSRMEDDWACPLRRRLFALMGVGRSPG